MVKPNPALERYLRLKQEEGFYSHYHLSYGTLKQGEERFIVYEDKNSEKIFDLASLTKAFVTAPLVFKSIRGLTELSAKNLSFGAWVGRASRIFHPKVQKIPLANFLSHTSGLPPWKNMWVGRCSSKGFFTPFNRPLFVDRLNYYLSHSSELTGRFYSDIGFILLGLGLELKYQKKLPEVFLKYCKKELSIQEPQLWFERRAKNSKKFVPTGFCALRMRELRGEVHDENCAAMGRVGGHAGLFGTGLGLINFLGRFLLTKEAERLLLWSSGQQAFGWCPGNTKSSLVFAHGKGLGHLGFTGCAFWLDPATWNFGIFLTNRVRYSRVTPEFTAIRREVFTKIDESVS